MNAFIKKIRSDRIVSFSFFFGFFLIVISIGVIFLFYSHLPPVIPLLNHMPWGEAKLSIKQNIVILPAISLSIFFINFISTFFLYDEMPLLSRILSATSLLVSILSFLLIIRTIQIII